MKRMRNCVCLAANGLSHALLLLGPVVHTGIRTQTIIITSVLVVLGLLGCGQPKEAETVVPIANLQARETNPIRPTLESVTKTQGRCSDEWRTLLLPDLNKRLSAIHIEDLSQRRRLATSNTDFEFRLWVGFGITKLRGFLLRERHGAATAMLVEEKSLGPELDAKVLSKPAAEWTAMAKTLKEKKVGEIADQCDDEYAASSPNDADLIVIETFQSGSYHSVLYSAATLNSSSNGATIRDICSFVGSEVGIAICPGYSENVH